MIRGRGRQPAPYDFTLIVFSFLTPPQRDYPGGSSEDLFTFPALNGGDDTSREMRLAGIGVKVSVSTALGDNWCVLITAGCRTDSQ